MEKWRLYTEACERSPGCNCVDNSESPLSIRQIQTILNISPTGFCDQEMVDEIMNFQKINNIKCDGCVGDETHNKMLELGITDVPLLSGPYGSSSAALSIQVKKSQSSNIRNITDLDQVIAYLVKGGDKKPVTMNDALWFAKMIHGETYGNPKEEDAIYMIWSLINRLGRGWWSMKLSKYVQNYSQPISPAWVSGGSRCTDARQKALKTKERKSKAKNPKKWFYNPCSQARLKKRKEFRSLTAETVSPLALEIVLKVFRGEIPAPPEPVSGWFANFMFNRNADASGVWTGGEGPGTKLRKVIEVRKNSFYERLGVTPRKVSIEPVEPVI